jgi:flagellar protein FlaG
VYELYEIEENDMQVTGLPNSSAVPSTVKIDKTGNSPATNERQISTVSGKLLPQSTGDTATQAEVIEALSSITQYMDSHSRELHFQLDENVNGPIITVLDRETQEIVRQIPTEEVIQVARYIAENAPDPLKGLLLDGNG